MGMWPRTRQYTRRSVTSSCVKSETKEFSKKSAYNVWTCLALTTSVSTHSSTMAWIVLSRKSNGHHTPCHPSYNCGCSSTLWSVKFRKCWRWFCGFRILKPGVHSTWMPCATIAMCRARVAQVKCKWLLYKRISSLLFTSRRMPCQCKCERRLPRLKTAYSCPGSVNEEIFKLDASLKRESISTTGYDNA